MRIVQLNDKIKMKIYKENINRFNESFNVFHLIFIDINSGIIDNEIIHLILCIDDISRLIECVYNIIEFNSDDSIYFNNTNNITMNSNGIEFIKIDNNYLINIIEYNPLEDLYYIKLKIELKINLDVFISVISYELISDIIGCEYLVPDFLL